MSYPSVRRLGTVFIGVLLLSVILASSFGAGFYKRDPVVANASANGKLMTTLKVEVFGSDGVLKDVREKKDDLMLSNAIAWIAGELNPWLGQYSSALITCNDDGGTARTFNMCGSYANVIGDSATGSARKGGFIGIGTGTTDPARSDYMLETKVESYTAVSSGYPTWDASTGFLLVPSQIAITGSRTITEAGLGCYWIDSGGTLRNVLLFRDEFAGISVVNTDIVAITYTIDFQSTSYLTHFANWIGGAFENLADGANSAKLIINKNTNNANANGMFYASTDTNSYNRRAKANPNAYVAHMRIGTSSTAVARTDYNAGAGVEAETPYTVQVTTTSIILTADIPCGSARTVKEAVVIVRTSDTYSASYICVIRVVFADVSVPAGDSIRVKLTINC